MAIDWSLYEKLLGNGSTSDPREVAINQSVQSFVSGMTSDPAYQKDAAVNGVTTPIIAAQKSQYECQIKGAPNSNIHVGDIIECYGHKWIVTELYIDQIGIINGVIWMCNDIIRFQNSSPSVCEHPCVVTDGSYPKISNNSIVSSMENTYTIYLSMNPETLQLYVNKRLSLGAIFSDQGTKMLEVYKIIGIDLKSRNFGDGSHLMIVKAQRDVYDSESDNIDENICDYYKNPEIISAPEETGHCRISGRDTIKIGTTRKYTAEFFNNDETISEAVEAKWHIVSPQTIETIVADNICTIRVPLVESLVGETIELNIEDSNGSFGNYTKKVQVVAIG